MPLSCLVFQGMYFSFESLGIALMSAYEILVLSWLLPHVAWKSFHTLALGSSHAAYEQGMLLEGKILQLKEV